nr:HEAT repeat-containing protein [Tanacetum cinerariifolium]
MHTPRCCSVGSHRVIKAGGLAEEAIREVSRGNPSVAQDVKPPIEATNSPGIRKSLKCRMFKADGVPGKRTKSTPNLNDDSKGNVIGNSSSQKVNADNGRVQQLVAMFSLLVAQGEQSAEWDLGEPASYKAAMLDPDKVIWQGAMDEKMNSMKVIKVWINAKVVRSKWLYKKKTDMD